MIAKNIPCEPITLISNSSVKEKNMKALLSNFFLFPHLLEAKRLTKKQERSRKKV